MLVCRVRDFEVIDSYPFGVEITWEKDGAPHTEVLFKRAGPIPSSKMLTFFRYTSVLHLCEHTCLSYACTAWHHVKSPKFIKHQSSWPAKPEGVMMSAGNSSLSSRQGTPQTHLSPRALAWILASLWWVLPSLPLLGTRSSSR